MKFNDNVVLFEYAGIPIVGCLNTGAIIGLTPHGLSICKQLFENDLGETKIEEEDKRLFDYLEQGGFFNTTPTNIEPLLAPDLISHTQVGQKSPIPAKLISPIRQRSRFFLYF